MLDFATVGEISLYFQAPLHFSRPVPQRTIARRKASGLINFIIFAVMLVARQAAGAKNKQKQRRSLCGDVLIEHEG